MKNKLKILKEKLNFYKETNVKIHVNIEGTKRFYNGSVLEIREDCFVLEDTYKKIILIFFDEVYQLDQFQDVSIKGVKDDDQNSKK